MNLTIGCPHCEEQFEFDLQDNGEDEVGDIIECPDCGGEMEIISIASDGITVEAIEPEEEEEDEEEDSDSD